MPINRIPVLSKVLCEKMVTTPSVIVIVGLPGTAKTFLSRKLCNYLNWIQIKTKSFIVEYYGTKNLPQHLVELSDKLFTDEYDDETMEYLEFCYKFAIDDIHRWLDTENGQIAILDGTSSTLRRRRWLMSQLAPKYKVFFVENLSNKECDFFEDTDPTSLSTIKSNIENILQSDKLIAESMCRPLNIQMMRKRMNYIRKKYEALDASCPEENKYIQIVDIGHKFVVNRLHGRIPSLVAYYLMNLRLNASCMYIARHGESLFNLEARIGGDSSLSENGKEFANSLTSLFINESNSHKINSVLTSTLKRTQETVKPLLDKIKHLKVDSLSNLDEIDAGTFDGLTYKQLAEQHGAEFAKRDQDKFTYRYPLGESYQDLIARLEPVILYLERAENVLVVCHQAVARCLIAYFMGKSFQEVPYLEVNLHTVYKLHFHSYQTVCEQIPLGIKSVCTHRPCPKNVLPNSRKKENSDQYATRPAKAEIGS